MKKVIHFQQGDPVAVAEFHGEWQAWEENEIHPKHVGQGSTMLEAIADLNTKIKRDEDI